MSTKVLMPVEEYLRTSFDGPDCEYLDGEVVERNTGEMPHAGNIGTRIPAVAPFLVVEVLSPEDRMVRMMPKIQEYLSIGVAWIWVIDPQERAALRFSQKQPQGELATILRTEIGRASCRERV